jgi:ABC-type transport system involved in multi-copper enzyme maturation permease subunit
MLKTIILHEIQEYIKTKKFLIGLLVIIGLVIVSTVINLENYKDRLRDYNAALNLPETVYYKIYRPPQLLSIFTIGKDTTIGTTVSIGYGNISTETISYLGTMFRTSSRTEAGLSVFDLTFLVKFVFGFIVMFFAFDSVAGEKVRGSLKQMLSNDIPRDTVIMGKFVGGLVVIILSLFIAMIVSCLIIVFDRSVMMGFTDWIRIFGMFGSSALYLAVVYSMSLCISVMVNRPSTAIMILMQLWLFFTILYPNVSVVLARRFYAVPTSTEVFLQKHAIDTEYERPSFEMRGNEIATRKYEVDREYQREMIAQGEWARKLSILSPAVLYDTVMIRLAKTGLDEFECFLDGIYLHYLTMLDYNAFYGGNLDNIPRFEYVSEGIRTSCFAIVPDLFVLMLFGIIFFVTAHARFLRKDVR